VTTNGVESVLYSFCQTDPPSCLDSAQPFGGLVVDKNGNFYGTTLNGVNGGATNGAGAVFEVTSTGTETVLYGFCAQVNCADGYYPRGGVVRDRLGNVYGTTCGGGANGQGVVFKITPGGTETVLHSFDSSEDGNAAQPFDTLIEFNGYLYGTAAFGGANSAGIVFKVGTNGGNAMTSPRLAPKTSAPQGFGCAM
jgi:uncharacterized repeat protein (TIGR03803 family)